MSAGLQCELLQCGDGGLSETDGWEAVTPGVGGGGQEEARSMFCAFLHGCSFPSSPRVSRG